MQSEILFALLKQLERVSHSLKSQTSFKTLNCKKWLKTINAGQLKFGICSELELIGPLLLLHIGSHWCHSIREQVEFEVNQERRLRPTLQICFKDFFRDISGSGHDQDRDQSPAHLQPTFPLPKVVAPLLSALICRRTLAESWLDICLAFVQVIVSLM